MPSHVGPEGLRIQERTIVAAFIFSSDDMLLMGRKNPQNAGVYPDVWHIPGGGTERGEKLIDAMAREANEEVIGLNARPEDFTQLPFLLDGEGPRILPSGETVWCKLTFRHFETRLGKTALELVSAFKPGDDLDRLEWFSRYARQRIPLIPGGRDIMAQANYIDV